MADTADGSVRARVSIGIPPESRVGLLRRAIDSVLAQSETDWELFVVDDGSMPGIADLLASYGDRRIGRVTLPSGCTRAEQLTATLRVGTAPFVGVLFGDDVMFPDHLRRMCTLLEAYPRSSVAHSAYEVWTASGTVRTVVLGKAARPAEEQSRRFIRRAVAAPPRIWLSTALLRRDRIADLAFEADAAPALDTMFWLRVACTGTVVYDPVPTACYRVAGGARSEHGVFAMDDGSYRATFGTVRAYRAVFRSFRQTAPLTSSDRTLLHAAGHRTIHRLLLEVLQRRWHEEPTVRERREVLREALRIERTLALDPVVWARLARPAWHALRHSGAPGEAVIDLRHYRVGEPPAAPLPSTADTGVPTPAAPTSNDGAEQLVPVSSGQVVLMRRA